MRRSDTLASGWAGRAVQAVLVHRDGDDLELGLRLCSEEAEHLSRGFDYGGRLAA
jgi:hypothetical protein